MGAGALSPDEVRRYQPEPDPENQRARAEWTLAWWLKQNGREEAAERHFERACELGSKDWTIRRGSMPIRGQDPFGPDFGALAAEGAPRYALEKITPTQ